MWTPYQFNKLTARQRMAASLSGVGLLTPNMAQAGQPSLDPSISLSPLRTLSTREPAPVAPLIPTATIVPKTTAPMPTVTLLPTTVTTGAATVPATSTPKTTQMVSPPRDENGWVPLDSNDPTVTPEDVAPAKTVKDQTGIEPFIYDEYGPPGPMPGSNTQPVQQQLLPGAITPSKLHLPSPLVIGGGLAVAFILWRVLR